MALRVNSNKQAYWLDLVQRWQRSNLSVCEFCQRHQLSEPSFYSWRRVLRERGLIDESANPVKPAFINVSLDAVPIASSVEVVLGKRILRVRPGFDHDMLLELVRLLEASAC